MTYTASAMLDLGTVAPDFSLADAVTGKTVCLDDFRDRKALLVMFLCAHCPYVKHIDPALAALGRDCAEKSLGIVAISSNDVSRYPEDSPEHMRAQAAKHGYSFPYLYDESQDVARAYMAACTPDFYLFDGELRLVYRGQFDSSRPKNGVPVTGADLRSAIDLVLAGEPVPVEQTPSTACNIKWKRGNEPRPVQSGG
jgi:peroxiredoxin